ncbi:MAG: EamA family transporter [Alphaproteobacteria bacterium]|nr:EamA family transporter [Alphaproteobacteria bacterium]
MMIVILINAVWGFNFVAAKYGVTHFPAVFFSGIRFLIVIAVLFPYLRWVPGQMRMIAAVAFLMGIFHYAIMFTAVGLAEDISPIAIAVQLHVPFSTILAILFLKERIGIWRSSALVVAFAGVVVIAFDPNVINSLLAMLMAAIAALSMAASTVILRNLKDVGVFNLQAWIAVIAAPGLFLISMVLESGQIEAVQTAGWVEWSSVTFSAIGATIVGHGLMYYLLQRYPVNVTLPYTLLAPIFGVAFGVTLLGDTLTLQIVIGSACTLSGVAVIGLRGNRKRAEKMRKEAT